MTMTNTQRKRLAVRLARLNAIISDVEKIRNSDQPSMDEYYDLTVVLGNLGKAALFINDLASPTETLELDVADVRVGDVIVQGLRRDEVFEVRTGWNCITSDGTEIPGRTFVVNPSRKNMNFSDGYRVTVERTKGETK